MSVCTFKLKKIVFYFICKKNLWNKILDEIIIKTFFHIQINAITGPIGCLVSTREQNVLTRLFPAYPSYAMKLYYV